jgi:hypothetical protein
MPTTQERTIGEERTIFDGSNNQTIIDNGTTGPLAPLDHCRSLCSPERNERIAERNERIAAYKKQNTTSINRTIKVRCSQQ